MDIGVAVAFSHLTPVDLIVATAQRVEAAGFASLWVPEHVVFLAEYESSYPYADDGRLPGEPDGLLDPFSALTFVAAHTETLRLGTGVCLVPQRSPIYTARMVADLDYLSSGRFDFGIGIGWLAEEFEVLGMSFADRADRCAEYVAAMQALWSESPASFHGATVSFDGVHCNPKPVQRPHPPIFVGGESAPALRRVAAFADGWYGFDLTPEAFAGALERLDEQLTAAGRHRDDVRRFVSPGRRRPDPEMIDGYRRAGADQVIVPFGAREVTQLDERLDRLRRSCGLVD